MGLAAFNAARRLLAQQQAIAAEQSKPDAVLERLNQAETGADLADIPTIGRGAGTVIIANRPEDGYGSLEAVIAANKKVTESPYTVDWEKVKAYVEVSSEDS